MEHMSEDLSVLFPKQKKKSTFLFIFLIYLDLGGTF